MPIVVPLRNTAKLTIMTTDCVIDWLTDGIKEVSSLTNIRIYVTVYRKVTEFSRSIVIHLYIYICEGRSLSMYTNCAVTWSLLISSSQQIIFSFHFHLAHLNSTTVEFVHLMIHARTCVTIKIYLFDWSVHFQKRHIQTNTSNQVGIEKCLEILWRSRFYQHSICWLWMLNKSLYNETKQLRGLEDIMNWNNI